MAETTTAKKTGSRSTKIGRVTSTKMSKTIVVQVIRKKAHPLYRRVVAKAKKFYAHDEKNTAHVGDTVEIEETRPMSKLKRWRLKNIIQKAKLVGGEEAALEAKIAQEKTA
jgi:small subunit ribosomal protein S17